MKLEPNDGRVVLKRLRVESALVSTLYNHYAEVVAVDDDHFIKVGDVVIEPEQWTEVPDEEDLIIAKIEHIPAKRLLE